MAILLAITNPSADAHRAKLAADLGARSPLAGAIGLGVIGARLSAYHSAVLGSYTTVGEEITSVGLLGMVWVVRVESP